MKKKKLGFLVAILFLAISCLGSFAMVSASGNLKDTSQDQQNSESKETSDTSLLESPGLKLKVHPSKSDLSPRAKMLAHKAGLYVRLERSLVSTTDKKSAQNQLEAIAANPILDAVILSATWRELEPEKGVFNFDSLEREIEYWGSKGKGVMVSVVLYGQGINDLQTPPWLYKEKGIRSFSFAAGGTAKGQQIRLPAVWDESFIKKTEPLVEKLGKTFDANKNIWFVKPGLGHIGNLSAQPSAGGRQAFLEHGFTTEAWKKYCDNTVSLYQKHFKTTPLLLVSHGKILRESGKTIQRDAADICNEQAKRGVSFIQLGLEQEPAVLSDLAAKATCIVEEARSGNVRLGLGDDWPLWVPAERRGKGPTRGLDDAALQKELNNAFGGVNGIPNLPTTMLLLQMPESLASSKLSKNYHEPVFTALAAARKRLFDQDKSIFSGAEN